MLLKLPSGPITSPKPGPTFDIDVAAADKLVIKSYPSKDRRSEIKKNDNIYKKKKLVTALKLASGILFPLNFDAKTPWGFINLRIWFLTDINNIWNLKIFKPPVVEPAHPPINIIIKNKIDE